MKVKTYKFVRRLSQRAIERHRFGYTLSYIHDPLIAKVFDKIMIRLDKIDKKYGNVRERILDNLSEDYGQNIKLDAPQLPPCSHNYKPEQVPYYVRRQIAEECRDQIFSIMSCFEHSQREIDQILEVIRGD